MPTPLEMRESRIKGYAKETAMCVDVALAAIEDEVHQELERAPELAIASLRRVLDKLRAHRDIVRCFTAP